MATITISLPDDLLARLRRHASAFGRSEDEVVQEAVIAHLSQVPEAPPQRSDEPTPTAPNGIVQPTTRQTPDGFRLHIPPEMSSEEADALAAEPTPQARREHLAAWLLSRNGGKIKMPPPGPPPPEWQAEMHATLARIHASLPSDMTPDEIEALITEEVEAVRQERIARHEREHIGG